MRIEMSGLTDIGRVRKANQDAMYYDPMQGIVVVADGIGGRKGGEIASQTAVDGLRKAFLECDRLRHEEISPFLVTAVDQINQKIIQKGYATDHQGMGTTLNCLLYVGDRVYIAHVGDSRTYLLYKKNMWQLTIDHNIKMFVERGWMDRSAISPGAKDEALVRSLGLTDRVEVDVYDMKIKPGEIFITCSDGLSGMVSDQKMVSIIQRHENNLDNMAKALVDEANKNGGRDNITVVVTKIGED